MITTAPGIFLSAIAFSTSASINFSLSADIPTACGSATGKPCAFAKAKGKRQKAKMSKNSDNFIEDKTCRASGYLILAVSFKARKTNENISRRVSDD
jgi:hypothetical protein